MKKTALKILLTFLLTQQIFSQVGIGTTTPDSSSLLDITSSNKGVLMPRISLVQTTNFAPLLSHVAGMQVYNTSSINDVTPGQYYNDGTKWIKVGDANLVKRNYTFLKTFDGLPGEAVGDNLVNAYRFGHTAFGNATNSPDNFFLYGGLPLKAIATFQEKLNLNSQYDVVTDGIVVGLEHDAPTSSSLGSQGSRSGNFLNHTKASSAVNYNYLAAVAGDASHFGTGTVNLLQGLSQGAFNNGSGNITNAEGVRATIRNFGTGTIADAKAVNIDITNNLGVSPVTNAYGLYINDILATNPYAIYQLGSTNKNYFAGNIGVKTASPTEALEVVGKIKTTNLQVTTLNPVTVGQVLTATDTFGNMVWATPTAPTVSSNAWGLLGNSGNTITNFLGNTDDVPLEFRVSNIRGGYISNSTKNNTFLGYSTAISMTTGNDNTGIGTRTLQNNSTGSENLAFGSNGLNSNTTGSGNVAIGSKALYSNTVGTNSIAIGTEALFTSTGTIGFSLEAKQNVAIGNLSLYSNTFGQGNTAIGYRNLYANTIGIFNVAIGNSALSKNVDGGNNVAIGTDVLNENIGGDYNIAMSKNVLTQNTEGDNNIALGYTSMNKNTIGSNNIAIGESSLFFNTIGNRNCAIGISALTNNVSGTRNAAIGSFAGSSITTGSNNSFLGPASALGATTGSFNIAIGNRSTLPSPTADNQLAIGDAIFGTDINLASTARIGIGTNSPQEKLHVAGKLLLTNGFGNPTVGSLNYTNDTGRMLIGPASGTSTNGGTIALRGAANTASGLNGGTITMGTPGGSSTGYDLLIDGLNGNVGIGGIIPTEKLDVGGNLKVSGAIMPNNIAGTTGQVLTSAGAGGAPIWGNPSSQLLSYASTGSSTGIYSVTLSQYTIRVFNSVSEIKLPTAVGNNGKIFIIIGSNGISPKTWSSLGGAIYDDVTNTAYTTISGSQRFMVQSDGTDWIVVGR
jgi:trimeric autotransporter adhesin